MDLTKFKTIWQRHGSKIHSLQLVDCDITDDIVEDIITYCDKLAELLWKGRFLNLTNTLERLISRNIVRKNVKSVVIRLHDPENVIRNYMFHALFRLFPNMREFVFICDRQLHYDNDDGDETAEESHPCSKTKLTCRGALQQVINRRSSIESFGFKFEKPQWMTIAPIHFNM